MPPSIGVGLRIGRRRDSLAAFTVNLIGLTGSEARQGDVIGVVISPEPDPGAVISYQWTEGGVSVPGATGPTETVDIGTTHADNGLLRCVLTIDGEPYTSNAAPMRYAPGTLAIADQSPWTVDDDAVSFSIAPTGAGLTFSNFQISGFPASLSVDGSGNVTAASVSFADHQAASSGTGAGSCQDQYGRGYSDTATWSSQLRPQATAGAALVLSFSEDSAIPPTDLAQNFTANGNTLTYELVDAPPAGLSASAAALTGTPTTVTPDENYTFQGTDEFGRVTSVEHAIEITEAVSFALIKTVDGEIEIDDATGVVTVTVAPPGDYSDYDAGNGAGVFIFDSADLATGPVNLVPPRIVDDGTPTDGETLTLTRGLWVYDPDVGAISTANYQWQADTAGNGTFADIPGATSNSYTLTSSEDGDDVRVVETLPQTNVSPDVAATSAAVSVASPGPVRTVRYDLDPVESPLWDSDAVWDTDPDISEVFDETGTAVGWQVIAASDHLNIPTPSSPTNAERCYRYDGALGTHQFANVTLKSFTLGGNVLRLFPSVMCSGSSPATFTGYRMFIQPSANMVRLQKFVNGTGGNTGTEASIPTFFADHRFEIVAEYLGTSTRVTLYAQQTEGGPLVQVAQEEDASSPLQGGAGYLMASSNNGSVSAQLSRVQWGDVT